MDGDRLYSMFCVGGTRITPARGALPTAVVNILSSSESRTVASTVELVQRRQLRSDLRGE